MFNLLLVRRSVQLKLQNTKLAIRTKEIPNYKRKTYKQAIKMKRYFLGIFSPQVQHREERNKKKWRNKQTINIASHNAQTATSTWHRDQVTYTRGARRGAGQLTVPNTFEEAMWDHNSRWRRTTLATKRFRSRKTNIKTSAIALPSRTGETNASEIWPLADISQAWVGRKHHEL